MVRRLFCVVSFFIIFPVCASEAVAAPQLSSFSLYAIDRVWVGQGATVKSGNIGVQDAGPAYQPKSLPVIVVDGKVYLDDEVSLYGDSVWIKRGASVGDVYCNEMKNKGTIRGNQYSPLNLPLGVVLPEYPAANPGEQDLRVWWGKSLVLQPGSYGDITVGSRGTLILAGGEYHLKNLYLGFYWAKVVFRGPTQLIIDGHLSSGRRAYIGPEEGADLEAKQILIFVNGMQEKHKEHHSSHKGVRLGPKSTINANIFASNGTIWLERGTSAEGAFIGKSIRLGHAVQVVLNNGFGPSIELAVTSPENGALVAKPHVTVTGTISNPAGEETGVTVNGFVGTVRGTNFIVDHVPLKAGENQLTVVAADTAGNRVEETLTLEADITAPYIQIKADAVEGIAPLQTELRVYNSFGLQDQEIRVTGPADVEVLEGDDPGLYLTEIPEAGLYEFTVEAKDEENNLYADTVTIVVFNQAEIGAVLEAKWAGIKDKLSAEDVSGALSFHHDVSKRKYESIYTLIKDRLPQIVEQMQDIELIYAKNHRAKYRINRNHKIDEDTNEEVTVTYYIYFSKDQDGLWKIEKY